ncbi:MAG: sulfate transporter CysZ [Halothiobacillus sp. 24-54-40]|jgi:CysZ protein|nr:MAG: sulfate transporter CysZ [Halothiobacillus sp. 35-54-62]OYZ86676.1 MAG: sulfate transporter CysZ [Halothiobacillus sp. 24-54-40]OZA80563.1 MAG: sulfate transporter CysZ [Halothiobacillus sp. 39-53-45]HQS02568.1 sulfate transporter CysZ [Halothiobacillus sp.]HQS28500.1 sulfate transporter CysZ [Halothiobacillus sp.]
MTGFGYVLQGFRLMWRPGIRRFTLIPLAINLVLFGLGTWGVVHTARQMLDHLLPDWLNWLSWLLLPLLLIGLLLMAYFSFTMIANFIAAPFNALLAQKLELQLTGQSTPEDNTSFWQLTRQTVAAEWRKLRYFLGYAIPLSLLWLVPGLNLLAPFLWFGFSAWMMALQYVDAPAGNHRMEFEAQRLWLGRMPMTSLTFGATMTGMTMIPVLNFLALPVGVCAATAMWVNNKPAHKPLASGILG